MKISTSNVLCIVLLLHPFHLASAVITTNPTNVTTCEGSPAVFTCVINESLTINWLINGQQPLPSPPTAPLTPGPGAQSTLSVTATSQLNGASVQCYYSPSVLAPPVISPPVYLSVQAPPSAPTNLTTTVHNDTSVLLAWGPPLGVQTHLTYIVVVTSRNGSVVYNVTVGEPQVTINTDPCDQYEATASAVLSSCIGSSTKKKVPGAPPSLVAELKTSVYLNDSVNITITLEHQRVCNCTAVAVAVAEKDLKQFKSEPSSTPSCWKSITLSLPPEKHFIYTITAYNAYGTNSTNINISTFSVIDITNDTGLKLNCTYNNGSLALGCILNVMNMTTQAKQCIIVQRYSDVSLNKSFLCTSDSNKPLSAGVYYVEAFDIINNTAVSDVPAVAKSVTLSSPHPTDKPTSTSSSQSSQVIGPIIVGVIGVVAIATVIGIIFMIRRCRVKADMIKSHREENYMSNIPMSYHPERVQTSCRVEADGIEDTSKQPSNAESNYADVQLSGKRPIPTPSGEDGVTYSSVVVCSN